MHNILIFVETLVFIYSSFLVGVWLLSRLAVRVSPLHTVAYGTLIGYCLWGLTGFVLGLAGFFDAWTLRFILLFIFVASVRTIYAHGTALFHASFRAPLADFFQEYAVLKGFAVLWVFLTFLIVFVPITGFDTLDYHLPIIQNIVATESLTFSPDIVKYSFLPVLAEIIYAVPLAIFNNQYAPYIFQLVQFSAAVIFFLLVYGFVKRVTNHAFLPIAAVLAALSMMDFQREILHGGYIDVLMFTTAFAGIFMLLENISRGEVQNGNLAVSAFLIGSAISMKYLALFFAGFGALLLAYHIFRVRAGVRKAASLFSIYLSIPALVAGFWYVRNLVVFGDPVYPMLKGAEFAYELGWWVADRTIGGMFAFPFLKWGEVLVDRTHESSSMLVILAYFVALYVLVALFLLWRRRFTFFQVALFASIHLYLWLMFFNSHQERYLLGSTMLLPILLVLLLEKLFIYVRERFGERVQALFVRTAASLALVSFLITFVGSIHFFQYKYRYLIGVDSKEEYIINIGGM